MEILISFKKQFSIPWPNILSKQVLYFYNLFHEMNNNFLLCRFLFWTELEGEVIMRFNLADRTKVTLVTPFGFVNTIKLDCSRKRVYWLHHPFSGAEHNYIKSCDYGGKEKKTIARGPFDSGLLGVLGDSLYVLNTNENRINVMNVSSGNITRKILVDKHDYYDLTLVDKSVQPTGE